MRSIAGRARGVELVVAQSGYRGGVAFTGREPGSNGLTFDHTGRLTLCQHGERAIARVTADGRLATVVNRYRGARLNSPNDLVYRANGDLYFTDPPFGLPDTFNDAHKELDFQAVFRLSAGGDLNAVVIDLAAPNGLAFAPDSRTLYVSNAAREAPVWMAYAVNADGTLGQGQEFAHARAYAGREPGLPDGLKVDMEGNLFATGPGGVHVFDRAGRRLGRIVTGVATGNVAWGEDGSVLYVAANHQLLRIATRTRGQLPYPATLTARP